MQLSPIKVLLTSCNGLISPSQIESLQEVEERKIVVIGADMQDMGVGSRMVSKFFQIPKASAHDYKDRVMNICMKNKIDAVIAAADEEVWKLSKYKHEFIQNQIKLVMNDFLVVQKSADKGSYYSYLQKCKLPCAAFIIPKSLKEFKDACYQLGYPQRPVVFKPRKGRGNRGFRIIQEKINKSDLLLKHKPGSPLVTLVDIVDALRYTKGRKFPDVVLMEYLPGEEYSVDVLADRGKVMVMVPKRRLVIAPGLSVAGQVDLNPAVMSLVKEIVDVFKFSYNVNLQFKFGKDKKIYPYEANVRVAASIAACKAAGANLMYWGIKLALGEAIPNVKIKNGLKMIRYYKEYYE